MPNHPTAAELEAMVEACEAAIVRDLAVASTATTAVSPDQPEAHILPPGYRLEIPDPTAHDYKLRDRPRRKTGVFRPATVDSFLSYVHEHQTEGTTVWVQPYGPEIVALLNGHEAVPGEPGWADHQARLTLTPTPEWKRWTAADGMLMGQEVFAELLEDGLGEIADPDGATLLEIAQTMHGAVNASWRSAIRLATGAVKMAYDEEATARAGKTGDLEVPTAFRLVLAPYEGEEAVLLDARLRWRMNGGTLRLGFKLDNPQRELRQCVQRIHDRISESLTTYLGSPSA